MKIIFEPRDLWIGVFWKLGARVTTLETDRQGYHIYLCLIPCFPIVFTLWMNIPSYKRHLNW